MSLVKGKCVQAKYIFLQNVNKKNRQKSVKEQTTEESISSIKK